MRILIYRPEKADNKNVRPDLLYYLNGKKYLKEKEKGEMNPTPKITRLPIKSSYVEVPY